LGSLSEAAIDPLRNQLVVHVADGGAGAEPGGSVALAAFGRDPEFRNVAGFALQLACPVDELLGLARGVHDGLEIAVLLDPEASDRLAGPGDALDDAVGPAGLDA